MILVRASGLGWLSIIVLIAGMLVSTVLLRAMLVAHGMPLHAAAFLANGIGLLLGAGINLPLALWLKGRVAHVRHSYMGLSMKAWSVVGALCGIALIVASRFQG